MTLAILNSFTGSKLTVVRSKNRALIGVTGRILLETKNAFFIIDNKKNKIKIIPKANSIFMITLGEKRIMISGNLLLSKFAYLKKLHRKFR